MTSFKKDTEWYRNLTNEYDKVKFICKCGHRVIILKKIEKKICDWCGEFVFRDKKAEFDYRMKEQLLKTKGEK